jgi:oligopeptide transport system substrate-binding protein
MKKVLLVLLTMVLAVSLFANGSAEKEDKTLNRYVVAKIQPFDPADMTDLYTSQIYGDIGEALFGYKYTADTYQLEPVIAAAMPTVSADGLVYTIKLKKKHLFLRSHDGSIPQG